MNTRAEPDRIPEKERNTKCTIKIVFVFGGWWGQS